MRTVIAPVDTGRLSWDDHRMRTADLYLRFASREARGRSPCYQQWAEGVADDAVLLRLVGELPPLKRQPNLVFAAARYAGITPGSFDWFRRHLLESWDEIRELILTRRTQTNEPGRCAVLLPLLAALPQPLALLEVGASAGLCLYPDRFSYRYGDRARLDPPTGPSNITLSCAITGQVPQPQRLPQVAWRAGIDLNPLSIDDPDEMRWLDSLIWPEHEARRQRLAAAIEIARAEPPRLVEGDLNDTVGKLAAEAPADATLVIFHSAVLAYLDPEDRNEFVSTVTNLRGHWISNEAPAAVPVSKGSLPPLADRTTLSFLVALDGVPVAYAGPHGQSLEWFGSTSDVGW